jgi:hypothetical protein
MEQRGKVFVLSCTDEAQTAKIATTNGNRIRTGNNLSIATNEEFNLLAMMMFACTIACDDLVFYGPR